MNRDATAPESMSDLLKTVSNALSHLEEARASARRLEQAAVEQVRAVLVGAGFREGVRGTCNVTIDAGHGKVVFGTDAVTLKMDIEEGKRLKVKDKQTNCGMKGKYEGANGLMEDKRETDGANSAQGASAAQRFVERQQTRRQMNGVLGRVGRSMGGLGVGARMRERSWSGSLGGRAKLKRKKREEQTSYGSGTRRDETVGNWRKRFKRSASSNERGI